MTDFIRPQSYANHRRRPPASNIIALLILTGELMHRLFHYVQHQDLETAWDVLVWVAIMTIAVSIRTTGQIIQDRVIRDVMRLRLERLLPVDRHVEIRALSVPQLVALRFASDGELPALVTEVTDGRLTTNDEIKRRISSWQADWLRI